LILMFNSERVLCVFFYKINNLNLKGGTMISFFIGYVDIRNFTQLGKNVENRANGGRR